MGSGCVDGVGHEAYRCVAVAGTIETDGVAGVHAAPAVKPLAGIALRRDEKVVAALGNGKQIVGRGSGHGFDGVALGGAGISEAKAKLVGNLIAVGVIAGQFPQLGFAGAGRGRAAHLSFAV